MKKPDLVYVLRTCKADMTSHGGFKWPTKGPVECPDWKPAARCGNGLHGLLWGAGDHRLLDWSGSAKWTVVAVMACDVVEIDGGQKVKFERGDVVFCGTRDKALAFLVAKGADPSKMCCHQASAGDNGQAAAGYYGQAAAGYKGQAAAGSYGQAAAGEGGQATAGEGGQATAGSYGQAAAGDYGQAAAGYKGQAAAGYKGQATAGYKGQATAGSYGQAAAGYKGQATAGDRGTIIVRWWDNTSDRHRVAVGYVGEDGIQPDTWYRADEAGKLVEVGPVAAKEAGL